MHSMPQRAAGAFDSHPHLLRALGIIMLCTAGRLLARPVHNDNTKQPQACCAIETVVSAPQLSSTSDYSDRDAKRS